MSIADELTALGIDSAELRVLAVRDYLVECRQAALKSLNRLMLIAEFYDHAELNAMQRGEAAPLEECDEIKLIMIDFVTARSKILSRYRGAARRRAEAILDTLPQIRAT